MTKRKTIFIAFSMEDENIRDLIKGQALNTQSPFEYIDMSVKEPYKSAWKDRVRTRIKRSDGVLAIISKNSESSTGQDWEIACAKEEGVPVRGIWAYKNDRTNIVGVNTMVWTWPNIANWIDNL